MQYSFYGGRRGIQGESGVSIDNLRTIKYIGDEQQPFYQSVNGELQVIDNIPNFLQSRFSIDINLVENLYLLCADRISAEDTKTVILMALTGTETIFSSSDIQDFSFKITDTGLIEYAPKKYLTDSEGNYIQVNWIDSVEYIPAKNAQDLFKEFEEEQKINEDDFAHIKVNMGIGQEKLIPVSTILNFSLDENRHLIVKTSDGIFDAGDMVYNGIYIGMNFTWQQINQKILEWNNSNPNTTEPLKMIDGGELYKNYINIKRALNKFYPNGLTDQNMVGKLITYGDTEDESKIIFGYDYVNKEWYYVGTMNQGISYISSCIIVGGNGSANTISEAQALPQGGIWFVTDNDKIDAVPLYSQGEKDLSYRCAFVCDRKIWDLETTNAVDVVNEKVSTIKSNARPGSIVLIFDSEEESSVTKFKVVFNGIIISDIEMDTGSGSALIDNQDVVPWRSIKDSFVSIFNAKPASDRNNWIITTPHEIFDGSENYGVWIQGSTLVTNTSYNNLPEAISADDINNTQYFFPIYTYSSYSPIGDETIVKDPINLYTPHTLNSWYLYCTHKKVGSAVSEITKE